MIIHPVVDVVVPPKPIVRVGRRIHRVGYRRQFGWPEITFRFFSRFPLHSFVNGLLANLSKERLANVLVQNSSHPTGAVSLLTFCASSVSLIRFVWIGPCSFNIRAIHTVALARNRAVRFVYRWL